MNSKDGIFEKPRRAIGEDCAIVLDSSSDGFKWRGRGLIRTSAVNSRKLWKTPQWSTFCLKKIAAKTHEDRCLFGNCGKL